MVITDCFGQAGVGPTRCKFVRLHFDRQRAIDTQTTLIRCPEADLDIFRYRWLSGRRVEIRRRAVTNEVAACLDTRRVSAATAKRGAALRAVVRGRCEDLIAQVTDTTAHDFAHVDRDDGVIFKTTAGRCIDNIENVEFVCADIVEQGAGIGLVAIFPVVDVDDTSITARIDVIGVGAVAITTAADVAQVNIAVIHTRAVLHVDLEEAQGVILRVKRRAEAGAGATEELVRRVAQHVAVAVHRGATTAQRSTGVKPVVARRLIGRTH